ncbi:hypothetical protein D8674_011003 [Pyrus ussuriensis x Pyrus communis]|uniref:Uncharacterized protein n=1 Tax=Pyrus ussuriensis x Pyrus communis TaxID=2448454 RepID=A0A5N5FXH4_9ROSA|nr:hypothetical protein D8674_011003 [Pyrus ussuriensis x Pyrus communis]
MAYTWGIGSMADRTTMRLRDGQEEQIQRAIQARTEAWLWGLQSERFVCKVVVQWAEPRRHSADFLQWQLVCWVVENDRGDENEEGRENEKDEGGENEGGKRPEGDY